MKLKFIIYNTLNFLLRFLKIKIKFEKLASISSWRVMLRAA